MHSFTRDLKETLNELLVINSSMHTRNTRYCNLNLFCPRYSYATEGGRSFTVRQELIGNFSTRRSWCHGRQPEVFLQHDNHCACRDVLELPSRTSKREFSG